MLGNLRMEFLSYGRDYIIRDILTGLFFPLLGTYKPP